MQTLASGPMGTASACCVTLLIDVLLNRCFCSCYYVFV